MGTAIIICVIYLAIRAVVKYLFGVNLPVVPLFRLMVKYRVHKGVRLAKRNRIKVIVTVMADIIVIVAYHL